LLRARKSPLSCEVLREKPRLLPLIRLEAI
jgi:hypothetical protein